MFCQRCLANQNCRSPDRRKKTHRSEARGRDFKSKRFEASTLRSLRAEGFCDALEWPARVYPGSKNAKSVTLQIPSAGRAELLPQYRERQRRRRAEIALSPRSGPAIFEEHVSTLPAMVAHGQPDHRRSQENSAPDGKHVPWQKNAAGSAWASIRQRFSA